MVDLLNIYETMKKEAAGEHNNTAEKEIATERMEILAKYAETATDLLKKEYGDDFTEADVTELASRLIDQDVAYEEAAEKTAEYMQAGKVMARSFADELNKIAAE